VLVTHAVGPPLRGENRIFGTKTNLRDETELKYWLKIVGGVTHTVPRKAV
jgi:hypothetical protein